MKSVPPAHAPSIKAAKTFFFMLVMIGRGQRFRQVGHFGEPEAPAQGLCVSVTRFHNGGSFES